MFEFPMFPEDTLKSNAALYGCSMCPPPWGCPEDPWNPELPVLTA